MLHTCLLNDLQAGHLPAVNRPTEGYSKHRGTGEQVIRADFQKEKMLEARSEGQSGLEGGQCNKQGKWGVQKPRSLEARRVRSRASSWGRRVPRGPELLSSSLHLGNDVPPSTRELGERTFPPTASAWGGIKPVSNRSPANKPEAPAHVPLACYQADLHPRDTLYYHPVTCHSDLSHQL